MNCVTWASPRCSTMSASCYMPDQILKKPARLTLEEYEIIKLHPVHGEQMLAADPSLADGRPDRALAPRAHGRRWVPGRAVGQ